jgi:hypothetical protein
MNHITNPHMLPKVRSEKLTQAIRGMPCDLMIGTFIGIPCSGVDTVVGAHPPISGKGTSTKVTDLSIIAACASCHDLLDHERNQQGRYIREKYPHGFWEQMFKAQNATQARLVGMGIIQVDGADII